MSEVIKVTVAEPIRLKIGVESPILLGAKQNGLAIGATGKSAYEDAVLNGFVGTLSEWLLSLKADALNHDHEIGNQVLLFENQLI